MDIITNQQNQSEVLQTIQRNNEQIIQMILQILKIQRLNNTLINQIINNNFDININDNIDDDINTKTNNFMNNIDTKTFNNITKVKTYDPFSGNPSPRLNIYFKDNNSSKIFLKIPVNITVKELVEGFINLRQVAYPNFPQNTYLLFNGIVLKTNDYRSITEIGIREGSKILIAGDFHED